MRLAGSRILIIIDDRDKLLLNIRNIFMYLRNIIYIYTRTSLFKFYVTVNLSTERRNVYV